MFGLFSICKLIYVTIISLFSDRLLGDIEYFRAVNTAQYIMLSTHWLRSTYYNCQVYLFFNMLEIGGACVMSFIPLFRHHLRWHLLINKLPILMEIYIIYAILFESKLLLGSQMMIIMMMIMKIIIIMMMIKMMMMMRWWWWWWWRRRRRRWWWWWWRWWWWWYMDSEYHYFYHHNILWSFKLANRFY